MNRVLELDTRFELATQPWQGRMLPLHQSNIFRLAEFYWTENLSAYSAGRYGLYLYPWTTPLAKGCLMSCKGVQEISRFTPITKLRHLVLPYKRLGFNGAPSRIWTDDLLITNQLLYRWAIGAGEREFFRLFLAATTWLVKMLDHLLSATSETHYLSPTRSFMLK